MCTRDPVYVLALKQANFPPPIIIHLLLHLPPKHWIVRPPVIMPNNTTASSEDLLKEMQAYFNNPFHRIFVAFLVGFVVSALLREWIGDVCGILTLVQDHPAD